MRGLLRLYRARDWLHFLPLPLATFDPAAPRASALLAAARGVAGAFAMLAFGYLLNSITDRHLDLDPHKNPLIVPGAGSARYSLAFLCAASLFLAAFGPWPAQVATVFCLLFYVVYSAGPRLKSVPVVGSVVNVALFAPLLFIGMRDATLPSGFEYVVMVCAALVLETQLIHEAADQDEDRVGGVRTTWLTLGPGWTALLAALCGVLAAFAAGHMVPPGWSNAAALVVVATFGGLFPVLLARGGRDARYAAGLRRVHRWCGVLLGAGLFTAWSYAS